jgi:ATP-dependent RNA helicase DOB1
MLPILKEMVEILFTDGLLQVVFATSTFAIGLNMPARSVIFTQTKKFSGEAQGMTPLNSMEYIQMAGRAGRRGKDDKGTSIICLDDNFGSVPNSDEFDEMFSVESKKVESKLRVSYRTNLQNSEGEDIDKLISNSFFSNDNEKRKIEAIKNKNKIEPKLKKIS